MPLLSLKFCCFVRWNLYNYLVCIPGVTCKSKVSNMSRSIRVHHLRLSVSRLSNKNAWRDCSYSGLAGALTLKNRYSEVSRACCHQRTTEFLSALRAIDNQESSKHPKGCCWNQQSQYFSFREPPPIATKTRKYWWLFDSLTRCVNWFKESTLRQLRVPTFSHPWDCKSRVTSW